MQPCFRAEGDQQNFNIREQLRKLFHIKDTRGIELFIALQRAAHMSRMLDSQLGEDVAISGPRWRLLMRLFMEERMGNAAGITPTELSQSQRVSKNTISALLRGLESQGFIQRSLDPADLRAFRIRLTDSGREYLRCMAPGRIQSVNQLLSGLDEQEQEQLIALLEKLRRSLAAQYQSAREASQTADDGSQAPSNQE